MEKLKIKLQQLGPLRPDAWALIVSLCKITPLKPSQSFIRKEGTLAYIADGLLKEYDAQNRSNPSIINFISSQQSLLTRRHNQAHYLKAILPTLVYSWDFEDLMKLYWEFNELKAIYNSLCAEYDENLNFRQLLLEEKLISRQIALLIYRYQSILPYLKKKDMANYLHVGYDYFVRHYHKSIHNLG